MPDERTEPDLRAAWSGGRRALGNDDVYGPWVRHLGTIRLPVWTCDHFEYLARAICYQQLATGAARTIHGRFVTALGGDVSPAKVLRVRETTLRQAGLSRNKLAAIRDLAEKVRSGEVVLDGLEDASDDDVVERLVRVRGIGTWTAHMFLMFKLHRPDVWPVGDLGVRAGYAKIHALDAHPTPKELAALGDRYRPWRSPAAFYCWRALETELT
jgi:DNA-3-methyladenine glycosylase II